MKMGEEKKVMMVVYPLGCMQKQKENLVTDKDAPGNHRLSNRSLSTRGELKWLV